MGSSGWTTQRGQAMQDADMLTCEVVEWQCTSNSSYETVMSD